MKLHEALAKSGATYRQLDYWSRVGYLVDPAPRLTHTGRPAMQRRADGEVFPIRGGSGYSRDWDEDEVAVASRMVRLLAVGFRLEAAAGIARAMSAGQHVRLGPGLMLSLDLAVIQ